MIWHERGSAYVPCCFPLTERIWAATARGEGREAAHPCVSGPSLFRWPVLKRNRLKFCSLPSNLFP